MTTITKSKPFYAVAGAGDLAVKTLRQGADRLSTLRLDRKDITSTINVIQEEARTIPYRAQNVAVVLVGETVGIADAVYGDLVNRGRSITNRIRRQKATQDLQAQTATTVRRTRTATTTAKKSASATGSAAKGATTRARKQAGATAKATRSAATSARKTAGTAAKAAADAAEKVGTQ